MNVKVWMMGMGMVVLGVSPSVSVAESHRATVERQAGASAVSAASTETPSQSAKREQQAKAAAELSGSQWSLAFTPMSGEKLKKPLTDTVEFTQGKVTATKLTSEGFTASNYTLTVGYDGVPVWETMQNSEKGDVAFWRGELHGNTMSGILSKHPASGGTEDFSFTGQRTGEASAPPAAGESQAAPVTAHAPASAAAPAKPDAKAPAPAKATQSSTPPAQKKKGWFGF